MCGEPGDDGERRKALAARAVERLERDHKFAEQELATHARWLTASLFAANSAGIIAVVNAKLGAGGIWAGMIFTLGVCAAMLSGYALQLIYSGQMDYLHSAERYWFLVKIGDPRDEAEEANLNDQMARANRWQFAAPLIGWISGVLFLGGAMATGYAMLHQPPVAAEQPAGKPGQKISIFSGDFRPAAVLRL
ncbi:hypothetical protein GS397_00890 [Sphingobium yanoikuyae]|uniref:Uncharacterized protein n=1 Tax=Sphingobium yanoikuyae TaxID=13690 RepID=A0A6P1GBB5_SPHYA|nr:hypothetical protein [Sphingobium yanoikuyae]QHD65766.1 hypothetical protein GS397_00890 [Sphingobium yanoikuyae]